MLPPARPLPPRHAVPAGRVGYDLRAPRLLLHTVVDEDGYEQLRATGTLRCDESRIPADFEEAYAWMRSQHRLRVPGSSGAPLLWSWAATTRAHLVGMAAEAARHRERRQVLLTCRVPRQRVLLSEFDAWHAVLLRFPVDDHGLSEAELEASIDAFHDERTRLGCDDLPVRDWPAQLRERVERSWERIFDLGAHGRTGTWQATVEHLEAGDVVDAVLLERPRRGGLPPTPPADRARRCRAAGTV